MNGRSASIPTDRSSRSSRQMRQRTAAVTYARDDRRMMTVFPERPPSVRVGSSPKYPRSIMAIPRSGDLLIRTFSDFVEVVDAITFEQIATDISLTETYALAGRRRGAVWRQDFDRNGRMAGAAILLSPRSDD